MATTKLVEQTDEGWDITVPLPPVPASRPRVTRWGTYYLKTYATWKEEAERLLEEFSVPDLFTGPVFTVTAFEVKRPKKLTRPHPHPDLDNFEKAIFDAVSKSECLWHDDDQIVAALSYKKYADPGEEPQTKLHVQEFLGFKPMVHTLMQRYG